MIALGFSSRATRLESFLIPYWRQEARMRILFLEKIITGTLPVSRKKRGFRGACDQVVASLKQAVGIILGSLIVLLIELNIIDL